MKIEIVNFINSKDGVEPAGTTTCASWKTSDDARHYIMRTHSAGRDNLWKQATRIRVTDGDKVTLELINADDPPLAPYSVAKICFPRYFLRDKPRTVEQVIAHCAAAHGKPWLAMKAHHADYNGHSNSLTWNDYRGYYVGEYTWAGRNVFYRGTNFAEALKISKAEYARQGAGASLAVVPNTGADQDLIESDPDFLRWSEELAKEIHAKDWTWKHQEAAYCVDYMGYVNERRVRLLLESETEEEFTEKLKNDQTYKTLARQRGQQLSEEFAKSIEGL